MSNDKKEILWSELREMLIEHKEILKKKTFFDGYDSLSQAIAKIDYHLKYIAKYIDESGNKNE